ncbi:MAG: class I SAM-dependent methyltransferase [Myxococcaceae bacterium]
MTSPPSPDLTADEVGFENFRRYYAFTPAALAIKECIRLEALQGLPCPGPILDVGCGDGLFARLAFREADVWGIDIDADEGRRAQASGAYTQIILGDIGRASLPEGFFGSCVANCSLEHVPALPRALENIRRSMRPGAVVYAFLPNREWAAQLLSASVLRRIGLRGLSARLERAINDIFRHHHLHDAAGWRRHFEEAGFEVEAVEPLGSTASTRAFEAFLVPSLLGLLTRRLTGRWVMVPGLRPLSAALTHQMVRQLLRHVGDAAPSAEFLVTARRPG